MNRYLICAAIVVTCFGFTMQPALAVPILQLYVEGGTYDDASETWVATPPGSSGGEPFRIWAIGNISGPGSKGTISDVKLSIAFDEDFADIIQISLTPSQVGGLGVGAYGGFLDPSIPTGPILNTSVHTSLGDVSTGVDGVVTNGGTPVLGDGSNLPSHGIFGPGTNWIEYELGNFDTADSPVGDFINSFPDTLDLNAAQINVYEVSVLNGHGATLHFDLYDTVGAANHARFAPFSHDADGEANIVPEPTSLLVWSLLGLVSLVAVLRRRRNRSAA